MIKKFAIIMMAAFAVAACGNGASTANDEQATEEVSEDKVITLKKEIMKSHDRTMAEMNTMSKLRKELKDAKSETQDTAVYYNAYTDLKQAHNDMMEWMRSFENPDEMDATDDEKIAYLKEQKEKVYQLEEYTFNSINRAEKVLAKRKK